MILEIYSYSTFFTRPRPRPRPQTLYSQIPLSNPLPRLDFRDY
jgi:hypothetical protein